MEKVYGGHNHRFSDSIFFYVFLCYQSNPTLIPSFHNVFLNNPLIYPDSTNKAITNNTKPAITQTTLNTNYSKFIGLKQVGNPAQWQKAFERAMGDFIPLLSLPSEVIS